MRAVAQLPQVVMSPRAHAQEHSLEVQVPFLQQVLGAGFALLPLAVGDATPQEVAEVLEKVWGGSETVIVISSDLSHYLPYAVAQQVDQATVDAMLREEPSLNHEQACGATPVNGLLLAAPRHGLKPRLVRLCNSGDTAGDKMRVVGYASLVFEPVDGQRAIGGERTNDGVAVAHAGAGADRAVPGPAACAEGAPTDDDEVPADAGRLLLPIARAAIAHAVGQLPAATATAPWLALPRATFVTLKHGGRLRGCIGTLEAHRPLLDDVRHNAVAAALHDSRFAPLTADELDDLGIEVSLLSKPMPMKFDTEEDAIAQLRPGIDGVVLRHGFRRGTFLPQVWEQIPDAREFLAHLKAKAGLPADFWSPGLHLERYTVRKWSEDGRQEAEGEPRP
jgi:AmmeMemoRadiSam system protein A